MNEAIKDRRLSLEGQPLWLGDRRNRATANIVALDRRHAHTDRRKISANEALSVFNKPSAPVQPIKRQMSGLADFGQLQRALHMQLELKLSRDRYRELYKLSPSSYVTLTTTGAIVDINPSAIALLGVQSEPFYGMPFAHFLDNQADEGWRGLLSKIAQGEGRLRLDTVLKAAGGLVFKARLDCLRQAMAAEMNTLLVAIEDISASKGDQNQLGLSVSAFDIEEGVMVTDPQMLILQVNRAFTAYGYGCEEVIGRTPHWLNAGLQDEAFYQGVWASIAFQGYWQGEVLSRRKNGDVYLNT